MRKKYNQILLFEEGSIDTEKHQELLEAHGIYILPFHKTESGYIPQLIPIESGGVVSAIGFEIQSERDYVEEDKQL